MRKVVIILLSLTLLACILSGCNLFGTPTTTSPSEKNPSTDDNYVIELSDTKLALDVFDVASITATVKNDQDEIVNDQTISWSSSNPAVVSVINGKLDAVSAGSAVITASIGEIESQCEVTVSAVVRPQLMLTELSMELTKNQQRPIVASVKFKSTTLNDSTYGITYSYETNNESVAKVENGVILAVGFGEAQITVTASIERATAAGIDANLTKVINVKVIPNFSMNIGLVDGESSTIYLQNATEGELVYKNSSKLEILEAIYDGLDVSENIVFVSSDEEILLVDANGVVTLSPTAQSGDKATIWCQYQHETEGIVKSNAVQFVVGKATVTFQQDNEWIIDLSKDNAFDVDNLFGNNLNIVYVYDSEDKNEVNLWNTAINKLDVTRVSNLGERTWIVEGDSIVYRVNVLVTSKVITTIDEFASVFYSANAIQNIIADGYYILGNNIDASGKTFINRGGWYSADGHGLVGVLDGRGYTINGYNITYAGGIFGVISSTATLKNIAFTNITCNVPGNQAEILGYAVYGHVENCYFSINELSTGYKTGAVGLFAQAQDKNSLKNIVVVMNCNVTLPEDFAPEKWGILEAITNKGAWENVFVVSSERLFGGSSTNGDVGTQYCKSVQRFNSMSELLQSDYYAEKKSAYPTDIWDLETMMFKSSAEIIKAEINALPSEMELKLDEATFVLKNFNACIVTTNNESLAFTNGKLIANQHLTSADAAKITIKWGDITKEIAITTYVPHVCQSPCTIDNCGKCTNESCTKPECVENRCPGHKPGEVTITLTDVIYEANNPQGTDFVINDDKLTGTPSSVTIAGMGREPIEVGGTIENGVLTISASAMKVDAMPTGVVTIVVTTNANTYMIEGAIIAWSINTYDDYVNMNKHMTLVATPVGSADRYMSATGNSYGYIVLGNDIDFKDVAITNQHKLRLYNFEGVFDGKNHTISNFSVGTSTTNQCGFIGCLGAGGVVKNLRLENVTVNNRSGAIAFLNCGTIENVYVKGKIGVDNQTSYSALGLSLISARYLSQKVNDVTYYPVVKNAIVELTEVPSDKVIGSAFGTLGSGRTEATVFKNCYAVAADKYAYLAYNASTKTSCSFSATGNKNFADINALWADETAAALAASLGLTK